MDEYVEHEDSAISELIYFGFLENLDQAEDDYAKVKEFLGPKCTNALIEIEKFWQKNN